MLTMATRDHFEPKCEKCDQQQVSCSAFCNHSTTDSAIFCFTSLHSKPYQTVSLPSVLFNEPLYNCIAFTLAQPLNMSSWRPSRTDNSGPEQDRFQTTHVHHDNILNSDDDEAVSLSVDMEHYNNTGSATYHVVAPLREPTPQRPPSPPKDAGPTIILRTQEGAEMTIDSALAIHCTRLSRKLRHLDAYDSLTVMVPFRNEIVAMTLEFCAHLRQKMLQRATTSNSSMPQNVVLVEDIGTSHSSDVCDDWEFSYIAQEADGRLVVELNAAAHFLEIAHLRDLTTMKIMVMSANKSPAELETTFGFSGAQTGEDVVSALTKTMEDLKW